MSNVAAACATLTIVSLTLLFLMKLPPQPPWLFYDHPLWGAPKRFLFFLLFFWPGFLLSNSLFCVCDLFLSIPRRYALHSRSDYFSPCQLTLPSPVIPPSIFNVMFFFPPSLLLVGPAELLLSPWLAVSLFVRTEAAMTHSPAQRERG